jgi:hypothetical protein
MSGYLMMLLGASLLVAILTILSPGGASGRAFRWITSLFLVAVLLSPLLSILHGLANLPSEEVTFPWEDSSEEHYREELQSALDTASKQYFAETLTRHLEETFAIPTGDVRCQIRWGKVDETLQPTEITILLSGRGIWKDTAAIEKHVTELLGCPCITALE